MSESPYKHVIIYGIDGGGAFVKFANTPAFDRIFREGAVTYRACASKPSISAECWGSLLLGVSPRVHGMTNASIAEQVHPSDSPFPSVFRRIREVYPDAVLGAFCDWSPILHGIVEDGIGVTKVTDRDAALTDPVCEYIRREKPAFLFIHSDSVDGAGHANGYGTVAHLKQISVVDTYIAKVWAAAEEAGIADDTLFCVVCDHGGTVDPSGEYGSYHGRHGGWTEEERRITFAAAGKSVLPGTVGDMNIRDLAAIILYALGIPAPAFTREGWTAQIPEGLFRGYDGIYRDISDETGAEPRVSRVHHMSETL